MCDEEYAPDIISVIDEDGKEHIFEELDRIETDKGRYVALSDLPESPDDEMSDEFIVLKVVQEDGEEEATLYPIEDEAEYEEVGNLFLERFAELYSDEEEE